MLFGNNKLLTDGVVGQGVVIDSVGPASTGEGGMGRSYSVKVRVQFPDGTTAEFTEKHLDRYKHGWRLKGDIVPVRYDGADHTKIAVDVHALEADRDAESAQAKAEADVLIAAAEDKLAGRPTPDEPQ
jgi:hypothetical protein